MNEREVKARLALGELVKAGGEMFREDLGSARLCVFMEDQDWIKLRMEDDIEIASITKLGLNTFLG